MPPQENEPNYLFSALEKNRDVFKEQLLQARYILEECLGIKNLTNKELLALSTFVRHNLEEFQKTMTGMNVPAEAVESWFLHVTGFHEKDFKRTKDGEKFLSEDLKYINILRDKFNRNDDQRSI